MTDTQGLHKGCAISANVPSDSQRTLLVSSANGDFRQREGINNYITMGTPLESNLLGDPMDYTINWYERCNEFDKFMTDHSGKKLKKHCHSHNQPSAVVDAWMKNPMKIKENAGHERHLAKIC